jgi:hypothetical protein
MKNVKITYPDGTFDIRTLAGQFAHFQDESPAWQANFYWALLHKELEAPTKYAVYSLTDKPTTK